MHLSCIGLKSRITLLAKSRPSYGGGIASGLNSNLGLPNNIWIPGDISPFLPQRPNEPDCIHFLKQGRYKYRATCKYHHPLNIHAMRGADSTYVSQPMYRGGSRSTSGGPLFEVFARESGASHMREISMDPHMYHTMDQGQGRRVVHCVPQRARRKVLDTTPQSS